MGRLFPKLKWCDFVLKKLKINVLFFLFTKIWSFWLVQPNRPKSRPKQLSRAEQVQVCSLAGLGHHMVDEGP